MFNNKRKGSKQSTMNTRRWTSKNNSITYQTCVKCGKSHLGECLQGTTLCYKYDMEGHYTRGCKFKILSDEGQNKNQGSPLRSLEMMTVGPNDESYKKNILESNARNYVYIKDNAEARSSKIVTG